MAASGANPLKNSGKPLFFRVAGGATAAPAVRLEDALRLSVRSLSVMQKEALVSSARTGATWRLASDEGAYLAGLDEAPCPLAFLSTGMVSAYMTEILVLARLRAIHIDRIRLVQDNYYTMRGSARLGTMQGGAKDVRLTAQISSAASRDSLARLVQDACAMSPVAGLLRGIKKSLFTLTHNGREIMLGQALPLGRAPEPDPGDSTFECAQPAPGAWAGLVRRDGPTPEAEHTVTRANDSLAAEQDRLLHVRVICTVDDDGVKHVEQRLYNPHGSVFHFLSDEAPINGGRGLAPDAASYISAGIGFCFMTQLGRYAKIVKRDLHEYRIVQDTHFSASRGSNGNDAPGAAEPVETHVYLTSNEDDDFARTALDMGERTCFLHALCRTDLATRITIADYDESAELPPVTAGG